MSPDSVREVTFGHFCRRWLRCYHRHQQVHQLDSTGDQTEQVQALREKYDVSDLSAQDYYDLMSELTNMNVLDAKDVMSMRF